jgi:peptide methionine sulfoxide reductase msrA/msrB
MGKTYEETTSDETEGIMTNGDEQMQTEKPAPAFVFTDFDGNTVSLTDFAGEPVYLKFWASWCSVCLSTLSETDELAGEDSAFAVITVVAPGVNGEKSAEDFKTWYTELGYENTVVLFDDSGTYMQEFGVRAFPSSAYIDANGSLIDFTVGHSSNDMIRQRFGEQ